VAGISGALVSVFFLEPGLTFGLFSGTTASAGNTFSAGTVTLSNSAIANCPVNDLVPNGTPTSCSFNATYSGSAAAYLALDILVETGAGSGGTPLYNPVSDPTNDLQVSITSTSPTVTYAVPTTPTTCPSGSASGSVCYALPDELVGTLPGASTVGFSVSLSIPTSSPTGYQGGTAQVVLTTHAAQAANNGSTNACTAGHECDTTSPGAGAPKWS
jgi:hypothetical protein